MRLGFDRRVSIAILAFAALLLLFFNFSQWYLYYQMKQFLEERISREIGSLAESMSRRIDPFVVRDIETDEYLLEDYAELVSTLDETKRANGLLGVSLYNVEGEDILAGPDDAAGTGSKLLNLTEFVSAVAGIPALSPIYRSDSLYLLSAFAPVYDLNDSVLAVLHVEAGYEVFRAISDFKRSTILMNAGSVIFMVLFVVMFYYVNRKLLIAQQALLRASAISSIGEMAATIAHEIRNPLGIIKNSAERIKRRYGGGADDPVFDFIPEEVERLNSVLSGYLEFAHPARGEREKVDLRELVETLLGQTRTDFMEAGIRVTMSQGGDDVSCQVIADRFAVRQAILNLLLNAKAAQPGGGNLDISMRSERWNGKEGVRIEIADSGVGIRPDVIDRVFDPFFTTHEKGSGLGLYVAKSVAELHAGQLTLRSIAGEGTVASLFLPATGAD